MISITNALVSATPAAPHADAFPEWPVGWCVAATSNQLRDKPLAVDLFGRRLVCYRAADGKPVIMDARCWHMGADLSLGSIRGDHIACPFHGWQYDPSGQCKLIPAQSDIPQCVKQQIYPAVETAGRIFVFSVPQSSYPLPFFNATSPADLIAAPPFEFTMNCPWWLVGANGFDLQHFAGAHDRRLISPPTFELPHPAARRILATFEVRGTNWRDRLTRRFAGSRVAMDVTVWSGTLAFVMAHFHDSNDPDDAAPRATSYGLTEIRPIGSALHRSLVRVTIFRRRRQNLSVLDWLDVRIKRHFIRAFLAPDARLLDGACYDPDHLIHADRQMIEYLHWLTTASRGQSTFKEPL